MKTPVLYYHPDHKSLNAALVRAGCDALPVAGNDAATPYLYAKQFDPVMTLEKRKAYVSDPGLVESRVQKVRRCDAYG